MFEWVLLSKIYIITGPLIFIINHSSRSHLIQNFFTYVILLYKFKTRTTFYSFVCKFKLPLIPRDFLFGAITINLWTQVLNSTRSEQTCEKYSLQVYNLLLLWSKSGVLIKGELPIFVINILKPFLLVFHHLKSILSVNILSIVVPISWKFSNAVFIWLISLVRKQGHLISMRASKIEWEKIETSSSFGHSFL